MGRGRTADVLIESHDDGKTIAHHTSNGVVTARLLHTDCCPDVPARPRAPAVTSELTDSKPYQTLLGRVAFQD
ncbi:hypothetical protein CYV19_10050 [Natronobacterium gregoryi SP2]|uniref:Uncharacterized protein n=1 Tax=Natronobacterium gregoryi (strain ATCC 43098 / DSM 3393 / CCM 3738 / CIP 104747 / IAM 13177 / JCM 8860 / NBRC 102187 / NCIMB 2189 / SP2) TaxID=797304 RepID=A0A2J4JEF6_NATGS|nr:hypothetical protein CYV19_10050 [Natronobacterium gregoryi SP2]